MIQGVSFLYLLCKAFGFTCVVDERREGVHDEDGERHALGIAAEQTDADDEEADAGAIDDHALVRHGRGHIVGSHEDGTEHDAAGTEVLDGEQADVSERHAATDGVEQRAECEGADEDADGDMPADDLGTKQDDEAHEEEQSAHLAHGATDVAEEEVAQAEVSQICERCGFGNGISVGAPLMGGLRP